MLCLVLAMQRKPAPPWQCSCHGHVAAAGAAVVSLRAGHVAGQWALGLVRTIARAPGSGMLSLLRTMSTSLYLVCALDCCRRARPSLLPALMPTAMRASAAGYDLPDVPEPSGDAFAKAVSLLLPYLLSHRSRLASAGGERSEDGERGGAGAPGGAAAYAPAGGGSAGRAARGADTEQSLGQERPGPSSAPREAPSGAGDGEAGAETEGDEAADAGRGGAGGDGPDGAGELADMSPQQRQQLAEAVDTAILKVHPSYFL